MSFNQSRNVENNSSLDIKEISLIFQKIDDQIIQLLQCSSDDFLNLNAEFKKYFKQSKVISQNASFIFESLSQKENRELLNSLQGIYEEIKTQKDDFDKGIQFGIDELSIIYNLLDQLYLPNKNLNQDIMTIKFLIANHKISYPNITNDPTIEQTSNKSNLAIDEHILKGVENEKRISNLKNKLHNSLQELKNAKSKNLANLDSLLNDIHYALILFAEKQVEGTLQVPDLADRTEKFSSNIEGIITNLQFHDIIRQKIEHIQNAHKNILVDIQDIGDNQESAIQIFSRIKEVSGIQAALLVKANKEYQTAIEEIINKFEAISSDLSGLSLMCQSFIKNQNESVDISLPDLLSKLKNSTLVIGSLNESRENYYKCILDLTSYLIASVKKNTLQSNGYIEMTNFTKVALNDYNSNQITFNDTISYEQITEISKSIEENIKAIDPIYQTILKKGEFLSSRFLTIQAEKHGNIVDSTISDNLNVIMSQLKEKSDKVNFLLTQNLSLSESISNDIKIAIKQIKYYDLFEKVIIDIILELNEIYKKLKKDNDLTYDENLKKLKKLYTMASEHIIHDAIIDSKEELDILNESIVDNEKIKNNDTNDVELF